ncbi:MAG TPA: DUF4249 domain-containing protein [Bacteroidales bacterium]|nr:DUF4249 domain-containing protein [Bacteroidales bacterium]
MKKLTILIIITCIGFSSCEKVINLDLDNTSPKLVIEGNIYNQPGPYIVKIRQSVSFDEANDYPAVSGAEVIIDDNHGVKDTLSETTPGMYATSKIQGIPGYTYSLSVTVDKNTYTASSTMPSPIGIDSIFFEKFVIGNFDMVSIKFQDHGAIANYYRIVEYYNGKRETDFYTISDDVYDGRVITYSIFATEDNDFLFNSGDEITIWLESIDKGVYDYFRTAAENSIDSQSSTPANPLSNLSNGALGYFSACAFTSKTIVF